MNGARRMRAAPTADRCRMLAALMAAIRLARSRSEPIGLPDDTPTKEVNDDRSAQATAGG